jgi:hypothetical protein
VLVKTKRLQWKWNDCMTSSHLTGIANDSTSLRKLAQFGGGACLYSRIRRLVRPDTIGRPGKYADDIHRMSGISTALRITDPKIKTLTLRSLSSQGKNTRPLRPVAGWWLGPAGVCQMPTSNPGHRQPHSLGPGLKWAKTLSCSGTVRHHTEDRCQGYRL